MHYNITTYLLTYLSSRQTQHKHILCNRGHNFILPRCERNLFRFSFLNSCLFTYRMSSILYFIFILHFTAVSSAVYFVAFDTRLLRHSINSVSQSYFQPLRLLGISALQEIFRLRHWPSASTTLAVRPPSRHPAARADVYTHVSPANKPSE